MTAERPVRGRLLLRPLTADDEPAALSAHRELERDGFAFLLDWRPGVAWDEHLRLVESQRSAQDLPEGRVPATFLVAEVAGELVGRVSIRHRLNDWLEAYGGHIGYGVRPAHRGRGHATEILRQSLRLADQLVGGDRVLLTCDDDNAESAAVIERCGGVLDDRRFDPVDDVLKRRYWVALGPPQS